MQALLHANFTERRLSTTPGGAAFSWPDLIEGDTVRIALRFVETVGDEDLEIEREVVRVRASLGRLDLRPVSGQWAVQLGNDSPEEGVNTTALLEHEASAEDVRSAVQALLDAPGFSVSGVAADSVTVETREGSWLLHFSEGGEPVPAPIDLRAGRNVLAPISFLRFRPYRVDGRWVHELRLVQSPAAFTDSFDRVVPPAPVIETVQDGGSDGEITWNEIQALVVPPHFRGAYQLKRPDTFARSGLLSVSDGPREIEQAIRPLADEGGEFAVTNPLPHRAHIEFAGEMRGENYDPLEVEVITAPPGDVTFELDLATAEVSNLLRAAPVVENLPFEIEVACDEGGPEPLVWTYRAEVTLRRELIHDELAAAQNIDWLRPPLPRDYVPFTPDQVITGIQHFTTTLGNGTHTVFTVDHNLATEALHLTLRENHAGGAMLRPGIDYAATVENGNSMEIELLGNYAATPSANAALAAVISTAGPVSAFQAHTHTIAQIEGLQGILDTFGEAIAALQAKTAKDFRSRDGSERYREEWPVPPFSEILPLLGRAAAPDFPPGSRIADFDPAGLPGFVPRLYGAVHDASPEELPTVALGGQQVPVPASPDHRGRVFENMTAGHVFLASGLGVNLPPGGFAASDGEQWYPVVPYGPAGESSYYPAAYERTLWQDTVTAEQLLPGRRFEVRLGIEMAILRGNTPFQWNAALEVSALTEDLEPGAPGPNLKDAEWMPVPVMEQQLVATATPREYVIGYRVTRDSGGGLAADQLRFGRWTQATAPGSARFGIRCRLIRADTANPVLQPEGFLAYSGAAFLHQENPSMDPRSGIASIIE